MRILLAPDKFKGSLTAPQVAESLRRGLLAVRPGLEVDCLPVADGGDGTVDAAVAAGYERVELTASGPTGQPVRTAYARRGGTAVVEMADVSGLVRVPGGRLQPLTATSRGTGEVVRAAVAAGCARVVLGVGGSASTDGGTGMLQALGAVLTGDAGEPLGPGGSALAALTKVDLSGLEETLDGVDLVVACDVDNPLTGTTGAAAVYAPQKGATPEQVELLERGLAHWADLAEAATGRRLRDVPGAGAAGGVGFGALVAGARLQSGTVLMLDLLGFADRLVGADVVVVGEGSLDRQTLHGKAPSGVAAAARAAGAEVVAVCGRNLLDERTLAAAGIARAYALTDLEADPRRSMAEAALLLERVGQLIATDLAG